MAWNRPSEEAASSSLQRGKRLSDVRRKGGRAPLRGLLAAVIVVIGAVLAWYLLSQSNDRTIEESGKSRGLIPEVAPATNRTAVSLLKRRPKSRQNVTASVGTLPDLPPLTNLPTRVYGEINGSNLFPRPLFKTREENHIAGLLTAPPGARCILNGFMPGEEERFRKSLDVAVEFEDRDTPDERATKEFMIELKKELKERVAAGENMTDIVQELRRQRNELANMKDKLVQQFAMLQNEGTVEEIMQFYEEANGILDEYGMEHLALRSNKKELYKTYLERKKQAEAAKQEPKAAQDADGTQE